MALILATDGGAAAGALPTLLGPRWKAGVGLEPAVLLAGAGGSSGLEEALRPLLPELVVVEAGSARAGRLNYGGLALLAIDLPPEQLRTPQARRLFDALRGLMDEGLTLLLAGEAVALAGSLAPAEGAETFEAALGLLAGALVLPGLEDASALHGPLQLLSQVRGRLLALAAPAALLVEESPQGATFTLAGSGSALLAAFVESPSGQGPVARLLPLRPGVPAHWPR